MKISLFYPWLLSRIWGSLILLVSCLPMGAMNIIPENTILLSQEEVLQKVKKYHEHGLSVQEGLVHDLRAFENSQVKTILKFLEFDVAQSFQAIQLAKKAYNSSKPLDATITPITSVLSKQQAYAFAQKAKNLGINPFALNTKKLNKKEHKHLNARAGLLNMELTLTVNKNLLKIGIKKGSFPTIELAPKMSETTVPHELLHIKENHAVTSSIIEHLYPFIAQSKNLSADTFKKLNTNLTLAMENFAAQYAILDNLLEKPDYVNRLSDLFKNNLTSAYTRPGGDHISLFEEYVAAENITKFLEAERNLAIEKAKKILTEALERKLKKAKELA